MSLYHTIKTYGTRDICKTFMPYNFPKYENRLDLWPNDINISRDHLLIKDYLPTKFEASRAKHSGLICCIGCERQTWPSTFTFEMNINRDHLLIEDYLSTKFEASRAKRSWVIWCTRLRETNIPTYQHVRSNLPLLLFICTSNLYITSQFNFGSWEFFLNGLRKLRTDEWMNLFF